MIVGVVTWSVSYILNSWLLPDTAASTSIVWLSRLLHTLNIELPTSSTEDVSMNERIGEALTNRLAMPAPTITVAH